MKKKRKKEKNNARKEKSDRDKIKKAAYSMLLGNGSYEQ